MACAAIQAHGDIRLGLLPRAISGSGALSQPRSVLMSMTSTTTKDGEARADQSASHTSLAATTRENWTCLPTICITRESGQLCLTKAAQ